MWETSIYGWILCEKTSVLMNLMWENEHTDEPYVRKWTYWWTVCEKMNILINLMWENEHTDEP